MTDKFALGLCGKGEEDKSTSFPSKGRRREFFGDFFAEKKLLAFPAAMSREDFKFKTPLIEKQFYVSAKQKANLRRLQTAQPYAKSR